MPDQHLERLLRDLAPQVLGTLVARYRQFDAAEDAVQEALLAATLQWPAGTPDDPRGWLITVATRRLVDQWRSDSARRRREADVLDAEPLEAPAADEVSEEDDSLALLFLCCHPVLSERSQIALTLRAVGGLTTAQIARAFLVPEATMTRRITRAKASLAEAGATFGPLSEEERAERLGAVLHVLYLIFNEGYTATAGRELHRGALTAEAIRLTRQLHRVLPDDAEVAGLLALMLLTDARTPARTTPKGGLIPLAEQDRSLWKPAPIREGTALLSHVLPRSLIGPYQIQAAIAAVHAEAATAAATDWPQILALYELLETIAPNPIATLSRGVALAMVHGPKAGLDLLATLDDQLSDHHRLAAVRAHLLEMAGDDEAARTWYRTAARLTTSLPERRYLEHQAARSITGAGE
jgi:RNA polymerase sigma factor (sigma-70 family)